MKTQNPWAAALVLMTALAPAAAGGAAADAAAADGCTFASYAEYTEAAVTVEAETLSLTGLCSLVAIERDAGDECPSVRYAYTADWLFVIDSTVRDPGAEGAYYTAAITQEETWVRSNSYCVLAEFTCHITVSDGSRFRRSGHTLPAWGYAESAAAQYKMFDLERPTINCHQPRGGGHLLPGVYVDGHTK